MTITAQKKVDNDKKIVSGAIAPVIRKMVCDTVRTLCIDQESEAWT